MFKNLFKVLVCTVLLCGVCAYQVNTPEVGYAESKANSLLKEYDVKKMSTSTNESPEDISKRVEEAIPVECPEPKVAVAEMEEEPKNPNAIEYTQEELEMMEYVVEQETNGGSLEHKRIVSYVIVNRVKSDLFPNTVKEVLTAELQFDAIDNYYYKYDEPEEITKQAVYEALNGECEDKSGGALYFYAPKWVGYVNYFENKTFVLEMEGHRFFK